MNAIDIIIIAIIGLSTLFGLYRGFIQSVLNLGSGLISVVGSFWLFPKLSDILSSNTGFTRFISTYTDSGSVLGNLDLSSMAVSALNPKNVTDIVQKANLPAPLDTLLQVNLEQQVFGGSGVSTVSDYVSQTILNASINIICFIVCFAVIFLAVSIVINLMRAVFRFPLLKQLDWLAGGAFGFARGMLICYVIFAVVPLILTVVPIELISELIDASTLAPIFNNGNVILSIMNGGL